MRKVWLYVLIAALLIGSLPGHALAAAAASAKPVAVVGFSGYNELKADIGYVGKLSGNPELALALEVLLKLALQNRGLEGLDKDRPWGLIVQLDEAEFAQGVKPKESLHGYGVVPVSDLKALLAVLEPFVDRAKEIDGGIYEVSKADAANKSKKNRKPLYVKQTGAWAFLADQPERLVQTPEDPEQLLRDLTKTYDLALRFHLNMVPEKVRQRVLSEMKKQAQADLEKQKVVVGEEEYAVRKILAEQTLRAVSSGVDDLAEITLGWALDNKVGKTYLDVTLTAKPDTKTARSLASLGDAQSQFAGFLLPEAALRANWTGQFSQADSSETLALVDLIRKRALSEIEKQPYDQAAVAAKLLDGLVDVVKGTLAAGRVDGGVAATLDPDSLTVVAGGFVADGEKLDATLKQLVDAVCKEHPEAAGVIDWKAGEHQGVKLHAAYIPIPYDVENRDKLVQAVGDVFAVVVGTGKQSAYLAFGRKPADMLKAVLDKSAQAATEKVPPLRVSVDLGALTKLAAVMGDKEEDRQKAVVAAALLEKAGEQDRVNLSASPVENGVQLRLELEEGILKAVGTMSSANRGVKSDK